MNDETRATAQQEYNDRCEQYTQFNYWAYSMLSGPLALRVRMNVSGREGWAIYEEDHKDEQPMSHTYRVIIDGDGIESIPVQNCSVIG